MSKSATTGFATPAADYASHSSAGAKGEFFRARMRLFLSPWIPDSKRRPLRALRYLLVAAMHVPAVGALEDVEDEHLALLVGCLIAPTA